MAKNKGKKQFQSKGQRFRGDVWLDQKVSGRSRTIIYSMQSVWERICTYMFHISP